MLDKIFVPYGKTIVDVVDVEEPPFDEDEPPSWQEYAEVEYGDGE